MPVSIKALLIFPEAFARALSSKFLGTIRRFSFAHCAIWIPLSSTFWRRSEQSVPETNHRQPQDWLCDWIEALLQSGCSCRRRQITAGEFQEKGKTQRNEPGRKGKLTSPLGISFLHIVIWILLFAVKIKAMHSWFPRICWHIRSAKGVLWDIYVVALSVCDRLIRRHRELESCAKEAANGGIGLSGGIRQQLSASAAAALLVISAGEENWLLNRVWVFPGFKMSCQNTESWLEACASSSFFFFSFLWCNLRWRPLWCHWNIFHLHYWTHPLSKWKLQNKSEVSFDISHFRGDII